jgi:hypothetical protein
MKQPFGESKWVIGMLLLANGWIGYDLATHDWPDNRPIFAVVLTWIAIIPQLPTFLIIGSFVEYVGDIFGDGAKIALPVIACLISFCIYRAVRYVWQNVLQRFKLPQRSAGVSIGLITFAFWLFWPVSRVIDSPDVAIRAASAQAPRLLLTSDPLPVVLVFYQELRNPRDPRAEPLEEKTKEIWRESRDSKWAELFHYRSLDAVLACTEPMWIVTPKYDGLTGTGTRYVLRQSDGKLIAGYWHRGE